MREKKKKRIIRNSAILGGNINEFKTKKETISKKIFKNNLIIIAHFFLVYFKL